MNRFLFLAMCVLCLHSAKANTYYFSSSSGSDDRSSKQAQSSSTPWKTLDKLNSFFSDLRPGDAVLLKSGDTFYGSITISKSGTSGSPITIGSYGSGDKPVITSLVTLSGWNADGSLKGVYESSNTSFGSAVNLVLLNGVEQELGRYPNSDADNKGYLTFESHEGTSSITDNDLPSSVNWTGAELALRSKRWVIDRDPITSQSGNTIYYTPSSKYEPSNKYGYFIQNDIRTLDKEGEWYYNPSSKKLSIFLGKKNPSSYIIQASTIDNVISSNNNSNIVFNNLQIRGSNVYGFFIKNGSNISVKNCEVLFSGRDGVKVVNHSNFDIENCTVSNSNNNGIDFGFNGSNNATVRNNLIINTGVFQGMGGSGDGKAFGIHSYGNGTLIEDNQIRNTGYSAIDFSGDNVIIKNNFIDSFCITKDDGGGIYSFTGYNKGSHVGRKIIGNIVMNGVGAAEGTNSKKKSSNGIYMDVGSAGVEITGNTVVNTASGIFFHNAHDLVVRNNTCFNNSVGLDLQHNGNKSPIRNSTITNNIFFSKMPKQLAVSIASSEDDIDSIGILDSNFYSRPFSDDRFFKSSTQNSGKDNSQVFSLSDWKNMHKQHELSARKSPIQFNSNANPDNYIRFEYNPTENSKTINLDGNYIDINNKAYSKSIVLKPYSSVILLKQSGGKKFG